MIKNKLFLGNICQCNIAYGFVHVQLKSLFKIRSYNLLLRHILAGQGSDKCTPKTNNYV